ncbi:AsmA-like C-terminal region-containing protein [Algibacter miyuki]|uniref:AsmA-like C-terminal region-containing protein n=1 Tax=Algibacter miyuki TaxID=1306933 RepID=A0ABV5H2D6_9FLAO|nr:AsmA-like C-terminal region-containing protein [Algibacter miyuki]MDN3664469.1 AsmA-like C-terminal region-containing protein [Algibacter miyuki]
MKKVLKIAGITALTLIILLIALPFVFQGKIQGMVKQFINENLNANVEFSDVSLSFIRSFPEAQVNINDLVITNFEPFKDETLLSTKSIAFTVSIPELFKTASEEAIVVNSIYIDEALVTLKTNAAGVTNYDITKTDTNTTETTSESSSFAFSIEDYSIDNSTFNYIDEGSKMSFHLTALNHNGSGTFSGDTSELDTNTEANVSFMMDSTNYLDNHAIKLGALIDLDLANSKYTFKENKGYINKLPIEFDGFVRLLDDDKGQEIDITFKNPESDFKNFLALIPESYSGSLDGVETSGDFKINGIIKGINSDETIPTLDINIVSNNASFKYPDLPKRVENIVINTTIKNTTGILDDTYVDLNTLNFKIDNDVFKSSASIKNITKNMFINANLDGVLNLANISQAYPVTLENELTGILKAKLSTSFDMNAIETNAFERIKSSGSASVTNFVFSSDDMANPIEISEANLTFNPTTVALNQFKAKTGESDLNASGTITNLLGFLLSDTALKGNFDLNSNVFKVSDFMSESETASTENQSTSASESLKIPAFLDCTINANAKTVVYDNLNLTSVTGTLLIKDQTATLSNVTSSLFDGALTVSGDVSTKTEIPTFNFSLGANNFDISKSFQGLELLQNIAPIAKILQGKLNTSMNLSGSLDKEFLPNLSTISGNALAELLTTNLSESKTGLMSKLESSIDFIDFSKLDLKDLKTTLEFANGQVSVKPFDIKYKDIAITVSGAHGFDKTLNYNAVFNVPAKYLGNEVTNLLSKIDSEDANNITIPVTANIGGSYTSPTVKTDLTSGVTNLTKQLVEIEKQKLLNKGKDKVSDLIGGIISGNKTKTDSTKATQTDAIKDALGGIISGNKTQTDTTKTTQKTNTTDAVKNVLGGFLKKKTQDTVQ